VQALPDLPWATALPVEHAPAAVAQLTALQSVLAARWMEDASSSAERTAPPGTFTLTDAKNRQKAALALPAR
jgi:hypothetical protein